MSKEQDERNIINSFIRNNQVADNTPFGYGKILHHLDILYEMKHCPFNVVPVTLEMHLTNKCSHNCLFCMYKKEVRESDICMAEIPFNIAKSIISDSACMGVKAITYSGGGEPTIHPQFKEVSEIGNCYNIDQGLITNGSMLSREDVCQHIINNFKWVRISVDAGSDIVYKTMHGNHCDFNKTIAGIKQLSKLNNGRIKIGVSFLLTSLNYYDMIKLYDILADAGIDYLQIKPMIMSQELKKEHNNYITGLMINQIELLIARAKEEKKLNVYVLFDQFKNIIDNEHKFNKCFGHALYPVISATQEVFTCCMHLYNHDMRYGKITKDNSFYNLWFSNDRYLLGENIDVKKCPNLCRLAKTNNILNMIDKITNVDINFLN